MAQVAKVMPSVAPQNIGVNRPVTYTRGAGRPAAPAFMPIEELSVIHMFPAGSNFGP